MIRARGTGIDVPVWVQREVAYSVFISFCYIVFPTQTVWYVLYLSNTWHFCLGDVSFNQQEI